jgi:hypothetical protein
LTDIYDSQNKRRFWILSIVITTVAGAVAALASIVLHYTEQGNDEYGCRPQRLMMTGKMNTNQYCTRELAACNYQPKFIMKKDKLRQASIACNEAVSLQRNVWKTDTDISPGGCEMVADHSDLQRAHSARLVLHPGTFAKNSKRDASERGITRDELKRRTLEHLSYAS